MSVCEIMLPRTVEGAIQYAVAYADIFDYPLTLAEIHRYLVGKSASLPDIAKALRGGPLAHRDGYFTLPGREAIVGTRFRRAEVAARMWPRAARYGRAIANLPFVRMVAVTGALAMDNAQPDTDVDYLIVTEPGRLWVCRALVIFGVVKPAARGGDIVCPNYFLSERALSFLARDLFTAHELAQMVPLAGLEVYHEMRRANRWTARFLPNAGFDVPPRRVPATLAGPHLMGRLAERALRTSVGGWLERWEMNRKVPRLRRKAQHPAGASFDADQCKGHLSDHGRQVLEALASRLRTLDGTTTE